MKVDYPFNALQETTTISPLNFTQSLETSNYFKLAAIAIVSPNCSSFHFLGLYVQVDLAWIPFHQFKQTRETMTLVDFSTVEAEPRKYIPSHRQLIT